MGFGSGGWRGDGDSDKGFEEPDGEPGTWRSLASGNESGGKRADAHSDAAPPRDGGKLCGAFHGFADVAEVIGGARVNGNGLRRRRAKGGGKRHGKDDKE